MPDEQIDVVKEARELLPIGTLIRFRKTLDCGATSDHPAFLYAAKGETGVITGHGTKEGYWATSESNPATPFGASADEFEVINYA